MQRLEQAFGGEMIRRRQAMIATASLLATRSSAAQVRIDNLPPPIFDSVRDGDAEEVREFLIRGESPNQINRREVPLLVAAAEAGRPKVMQVILEFGPLLELTDPQGNTALIVAAKRGHKAMVELLLSRKVRIDTQNRTGSTALIEAATAGHETVVQVLLQAGADFALTDYAGHTALSSARAYGHQDIQAILIKAGARK